MGKKALLSCVQAREGLWLLWLLLWASVLRSSKGGVGVGVVVVGNSAPPSCVQARAGVIVVVGVVVGNRAPLSRVQAREGLWLWLLLWWASVSHLSEGGVVIVVVVGNRAPPSRVQVREGSCCGCGGQ